MLVQLILRDGTPNRATRDTRPAGTLHIVEIHHYLWLVEGKHALCIREGALARGAESFVAQHGRIDLNKKAMNLTAKGSKVMCKGFVQSKETEQELNFDSLCRLVESGQVDGVNYIAVPTTVWQR